MRRQRNYYTSGTSSRRIVVDNLKYALKLYEISGMIMTDVAQIISQSEEMLESTKNLLISSIALAQKSSENLMALLINDKPK